MACMRTGYGSSCTWHGYAQPVRKEPSPFTTSIDVAVGQGPVCSDSEACVAVCSGVCGGAFGDSMFRHAAEGGGGGRVACLRGSPPPRRIVACTSTTVQPPRQWLSAVWCGLAPNPPTATPRRRVRIPIATRGYRQRRAPRCLPPTIRNTALVLGMGCSGRWLTVAELHLRRRQRSMYRPKWRTSVPRPSAQTRASPKGPAGTVGACSACTRRGKEPGWAESPGLTLDEIGIFPGSSWGGDPLYSPKTGDVHRLAPC